MIKPIFFSSASMLRSTVSFIRSVCRHNQQCHKYCCHILLQCKLYPQATYTSENCSVQGIMTYRINSTDGKKEQALAMDVTLSAQTAQPMGVDPWRIDVKNWDCSKTTC